jgi:hypothetical protein
MSPEMGGESFPLLDATTFKRFLIAEGKNPGPNPPPKFIKRMDEISLIALPLDQPMQIVVSLAVQALVG